MTTPPGSPRRTRPDATVGRDSGFDLGAAFEDLTATIGALQATVAQTGRDTISALDMSGRYGGAGGGGSTAAARAARIRPTNLIQQVAKDQGITLSDPTAGQTKTSSYQAMSSVGHARAAAAQWLGEAIAGPLYAPTTASQGGPAAPAGGTTTTTLAGAGGRGSTGGGPPGGGPPGGGSPPGGGGGGVPGGPPPPGARGQQGPTFMTSLGARIAASGGTGHGIMRAIRDVPVIGLGVEGVEGLQNQREKNRAFQEVEGGSNLSGISERGHQLAYQLSTLGGMSPGNASQAFMGVTNLGMNGANVGPQGGQNRQNALNFVYHNYMARGMDIEDSLKLLETASDNTTISFQSLSDVLKNVSDTAGKAGVNAEQMRQSFEGIFQQAVQNGAGGGAPAIAGALATQQASYGRAFENTTFGNETSQMMQYMLSGKYGLTPGATQYIMQTQPQSYARMLAGNNGQIISGLLDQSQTGQIQKMIQSYGGSGALNPAKTQQIANQFFGANYQSLNPDVMAQVINQQTGLNLNSNNVIPWIVNQVAGNNEAAAAGAVRSGAPVSARDTTGARTGPRGLATRQSHMVGGARAGNPGTTAGSTSWQGTLLNDQGSNDAAARVYLNNEKRSGMRSPVLEGILQNVRAGSMVTVNTRSGQRVMSLTDAMRFYPNELAQGNAVFRTGNQAGNSVSQVTGGLVDSSASTAGEMQQRAGSNLGQSIAAWNKAHPASGGTPAGRPVTVTLSSEARQLLKLLPSNSNPAAAAGAVPVNPYAGTASR